MVKPHIWCKEGREMNKRTVFGVIMTLILTCTSVSFGTTMTRAANDLEFKSFNIDIGRNFASGAAITPDCKTVYAMNYDPTASVIDATQDSFVKLIDLSASNPGLLSGGVVVNSELYALGHWKVVIMDTATEHVVNTIPQSMVGGVLCGRAVVSPAMDIVYTVYGSANTMLAINTATFQLHGSVNIGRYNTGIGLSPSGHRIYISDCIEGHLTIIDAEALAIIATKAFTSALLSYTTAVAVGRDGLVYVGYVNSEWKFTIAVLDPDGNLIDTVTTDQWSTGLEVSRDGKYLVTGAGMIIDVDTMDVIARVSTGIGSYQVSMSPDGRRAYITNFNSEYVTVIEGFPVPLVIAADLDIEPDTLNLRSKGKWVTAYVELPDRYNISDIDISTIMLNDTVSVDSEAPAGIGDYDEDGILDLMVKFDRQEVVALFSVGEATLTITGEVDHTPFEGSDTIRVIDE